MNDLAGPPEPAPPPQPDDPDEPAEPAEPVDPAHPAVAEDPEPEVESRDADGADLQEHDEPAPRRYPSTVGGAFYLAVLAAAVTALVITYGGDWRVGVRVLAAGLGAAGLMRLVLPQRDAGMLAVRHRMVDVVMLVTVAAVLWWLAGSIPDQPPV
ncbi:DUF3017 domain-containing protein [Nocardioides rubriscoriae]|uniref:DUF3017 domain-containing protein n=1 Tax=Nocardioides rubriscoriae TaxID=642762 RepID=UPI001FE7B7FF|nr:DUF3017 domain-containing protein [Nocardioides rubriscoriae]